LTKYLQMEAKDKKGIENTSTPVYKHAFVPGQPNFCDCGLYLLHFVETFMSDPEGYCKHICRTTKSSTSEERNQAWNGDSVPAMREGMTKRILEESEVWKEAKIRRESEKKEAGDSKTAGGREAAAEESDDMIIVDDVIAEKPPVAKKAPRKKKSVLVKAPVEQKAMRMR